MADSNVNTLEFNSNVAVLIRCNKIIDAINDARFRTTQFDPYGNVMAEAEEVLSHIICLYKEICVELKPTEEKIWGGLSSLRDKLRVNPPKPKLEKMSYWRKTIADIDDLDIKLRLLAKKHGFLSSNKDDPRLAVLKR